MKKLNYVLALAFMALLSGSAMAINDNDTNVANNTVADNEIIAEPAALPADSAAAEKPKGVWTTSSKPAVKLSEFFFENWSKSGNSLIDLTSTFFGNYKYTHPRYVWDNIVDLAYGYAWQDLDNSKEGGLFETRRKSNDKIDLTSALSWKAYKDWGASFTANLKTQFGEGREYAGLEDKEGTVVSRFFAPAYLTTALSFEYKKTDWSVSLSFLTGKTTFVYDDTLIAHGLNYGVIQPDDFDINDPSTYNHVYFALGSYIKAQYLKKDILPNLDLYARLELFYDYSKPKNMAWDKIKDFQYDETNPEAAPEKTKYSLGADETWEDLAKKSWLQERTFETDLDFELKLDYRLYKFISVNFALNLKWDTDFSGMGKWGHWQVYQMAGINFFLDWKTPKQ